MRHTLFAALIALASAGDAAAAPCGGSFPAFLDGLRAEAVQRGHAPAAVERFLAGARQDPEVLRRDRAQGFFTLPFTEFARRLVSENRLVAGRRNAERHAAALAEAERRFGVPPGILLAFWALETDFGAVQGDINTRDALLTLAHDCRRPQLFRPQVFAALALHEKGDFDPVTTTGAWAGEIGQVQMLPRDILELGVDGDGDGHV
ncbi:MAG: lytic murein transglycosylase, partial [Alphaproteobacteria bacterium HGW-Alphaproteobacteria-2]